MTRFRLSVGMPCALGAALSALVATLPVAAPAARAASSDWPGFRGPGARGVSDDARLPVRWSATENVAWKAEVPGRGWSSPVVWGSKVFLTSVVSDAPLEEPKKGLYFGGDRPEVPTAKQTWVVLAYDLGTGRELWRREALRRAPATGLHVKNTYASETPVTDGERLYAYFGNAGLYCLDLEGRPLWSTNWPAVKTRYGWGSAASPVLHQDRLYLVNDNEEASFAVCLDAKTGRQLWRVERDEPSNWATPFVWQHARGSELITPGRTRVRSYDLDGKPRWELGGMSSIVIPTPFSEFGLLYVCSGYVGDKLRPVYAIRPGARGDISLKAGETNNTFVAWSQPAAAPYNPSPLVYGDYFYVLFDFGFLSCHDARTGRLVYEKQRIQPEAAAGFTASPWGARGKVFALSEDGDTFVFEAGPAYARVGKNSLGEMCMATPALAGDRLLIRTLGRLVCIRESR
jgi:outer membrane protein assembly factor BamB